MKILFITVGGIETASTRFRVLQILPKLEQRGIETKTLRISRKPWGYWDAVKLLFYAFLYDIVYIQKKVLPPFFLNLLRVINSRLIYDFDDALYAKPPFQSSNVSSEREEQLRQMIEKVKAIIVGNQVLANYAEQYNKNVIIAPTVPGFLETLNNPPMKEHNNSVNPLIIGWIGNPENLYYLEQIKEVFKLIGEKYTDYVKLKVVSSASFVCSGINIENKKWDLKKEVEDILTFDIGIMPLTNDERSRGKCGFKALECMSFGIPVVASPVGVNKRIVKDGVNGFIAHSIDEWEKKLTLLLEDEDLRSQLGQNARSFIKDKYSLERYFQIVLAQIEGL